MNPDLFRRRLVGFTTVERPRAEIPTAEVAEGVATIRLYDPIDSWGEYWGTSAKELAKELDQLPADVTEVRLHLNSPGGDVFDGLAILNALRAHPAKVVAIVDGLAASAASFIAAGADEMVMMPNSELMIHDAWGCCCGNASDMEAMADLLNHVSDNIASIYAAKAGGDAETWRDAMRRESWFSADEAVANGLADRVAEPAGEPEPKNRFDLSIFQFAGRNAAPAPDLAAAHPEPTAPLPAHAGDHTATSAVRRWTATQHNKEHQT